MSDESNIDKTSDGKNDSSVTDMLFGRRGTQMVDSETMIQQTQIRVWKALKQGVEYSPFVDESEIYLRQHVAKRVSMCVLYVDLVGSTEIALSLPGKKVATIISSFAQEMAQIITQNDGYVLKFVGDAVLGYFVADNAPLLVADNAVSCAKSMVEMIEKGINPILNQYDYPDLKIKIGIDFGENIIVRYGSDEKRSHVDILGPAMNIAAKIQGMAKPNQILIGDYVFSRLHPTVQDTFEKMDLSETKWKYRDRETGQIYPVFVHRD